MKSERWIVIPRWEEFQHYGDRNPIWVRRTSGSSATTTITTTLLRKRGLLQGLWLIRAEGGNDIRESRARRELVRSEPTRGTSNVILKHSTMRDLSSFPLASR